MMRNNWSVDGVEESKEQRSDGMDACMCVRCTLLVPLFSVDVMPLSAAFDSTRLESHHSPDLIRLARFEFRL